MEIDKVLDNINFTLNSLEKSSSWGLVMLFATAFTALFGEGKIIILNISIPQNISGIITFSILCGINFQILRHMKNLDTLINILTPDTDVAFMNIRLHNWIFNPFAETTGRFSWLSDNIGYALLLIIWWLGAHTGFYLLKFNNGNQIILLIGISLFIIYLVLGLICMYFISGLIRVICDNQTYIKIKNIMTIIAIPIGSFGLLLLFS